MPPDNAGRVGDPFTGEWLGEINCGDWDDRKHLSAMTPPGLDDMQLSWVQDQFHETGKRLFGEQEYEEIVVFMTEHMADTEYPAHAVINGKDTYFYVIVDPEFIVLEVEQAK